MDHPRRDPGARRTERGDPASLPAGILFAFDRADTRGDAEPTSRKPADLIARTRPGRVLVEGHTDGRGADADDRRLSERRAEAVARRLSGDGVPAGPTQSRGPGETRPVASDQRPNGADCPEGRRRNRRVEVVLRRV